MRANYVFIMVCLFLGSAFAQSGFQTQSINLSGSQERLVSADLNGDGKPDLVLFGSAKGAVMLNNGDGSFSSPVVVDPNIFNMQFMQVADFNNDGIPDLVGCGTGTSENPHLIIYLNDGAGNFTPSTNQNLTHDCQGLQVGDTNGDGNQDVILGVLDIFFGNGAGGFNGEFVQTINVNPTQHPEITGCFASGFRAADFFNNGRVSLLVTGVCNHPAGQPNVVGQNTSDYGTLYAGWNDGTGGYTFYEVDEANVTWNFTGNAVDVDGDGLPDVLMTHRLDQVINGQQFLEAVDVAFNTGDGGFNVVDMFNLDATNTPNNTFVFSAASADWELDGLPDVVVGYLDGGTTAMAMVDASSNTNWTITDVWDPGGQVKNVIAGDFNGDGLPDIAALAIHSDLSITLLVYTGVIQ